MNCPGLERVLQNCYFSPKTRSGNCAQLPEFCEISLSRLYSLVLLPLSHPPLSLSQSVEIWLGGLFTPEAYITATRQYVAQANNWSLEELYLDVRITSLPPLSLFSIYLSSCDSLENLIQTANAA